MTTAIEIDGLVKRYGTLTAVDGVSLTVARGEVFGLLGPNGAGKTTTMEVVEGLRRPDAGHVTVLGEPSWPRTRARLGRIGVQLQRTAFFDRQTATEQLRTFSRIYGAPDRRVAETLDLVGLTHKAGDRVEKLSGGQVQRLALACALVHDPELVFLDEPTAALDPQARRNLWDVIQAVSDRGVTVVLSTHHLDEAELLCDRVAIMDAGRVLALDAPAALVRALDTPVRIVLDPAGLPEGALDDLPGAGGVVAEERSVTVQSVDPGATLAALAGRGALAGLQVHGASLEDVFLSLTGREYRE